MLRVEELLSGISKTRRDKLLKIADLFGKEEILDKAEAIADNKESKKAVQNIRDVYRILKLYGLEKYILIDLTEVRGLTITQGYSLKYLLKG